MWERGMIHRPWGRAQQRLPAESPSLQPNDEMIQLAIRLQFNAFIWRESCLAVLIQEVFEALLSPL